MSCSLGIQKTVEKILGNKPWFNYNQAESYIEISESPNKKINLSNFFSVAQTISQTINTQINKGDKKIGDISYPTYINNSPVVKIAPTKAQLDLLNAEDQQEILELEKEIAQEKQQEEFNQLEKESNSINVEGEILTPFFQNKSSEEINAIVASEKTIRDLAAKLAHRIGYNVTFEADKSKNYKGKLQGHTAVINLANATLDTPIHEILGHPIIRALKNYRNSNLNNYVIDEIEITKKLLNKEITREEAKKLREKPEDSQLYQNLLKELETGRGKEVLDRIKRDYNKKFNGEWYVSGYGEHSFKKDGTIDGFKPYNNEQGKYKIVVQGKVLEFNNRQEALNYVYYTPEEQQEEAIVELLGLMTAEKLDNVKDGKLISLLKRLLKEMKQFIRSLINQKEVEIDKLPDNMTLGDLSDLLAYSNSKLILPGYEVEYTTSDNQKFKTYQEASNHISELAKSVKDVDLNIKIPVTKIETIEDVRNLIESKQMSFVFGDISYIDGEFIGRTLTEKEGKIIPDDEVVKEAKRFKRKSEIEQFIEKNKEYEQSKEIIEEWKKVNNIQYNPEEIYSRGQEFVSVVGAYSDFDVNLMMQNLLSHIEDNEKANNHNKITSKDKIVFGHPGIGKTYLRESGRTDVIDFDSDYKIRINEKFNLPEGFKARNDFQKSNKEEYQKAVRELWIEAKKESKKTGKQLFASDMILLREFANDFDKVITMSKETFVNRAKQRNDYTQGETESWKNSLDTEINKLDKSRVINTTDYLSNLFSKGSGFAISAYTKPIDKKIGHLEGGGGKIKFKLYPQSNDILWAANTDVYSGSVWDASEKVNKDKKSELLGVSYTKYPSLSNVNTVQPNLASIVDDLAHHHNELGIVLTGNNFRLEYDEDIPYQTKKIIDGINKILDQKYGKLVSPDIKKTLTNRSKYKFGYEIFDDLEKAKKAVDSASDFLDDDFSYAEIKEIFEIGIQPTQTNETLKESIDDIKIKITTYETALDFYNKAKLKYNDSLITYKTKLEKYEDNHKGIIDKYYGNYTDLNGKLNKKVKVFTINVGNTTNEVGMWQNEKDYDTVKDYIVKEEENQHGVKFWVLSNEFKKEALKPIEKPQKPEDFNLKKPLPENYNIKEYTEQALINTKIAALKEVAKKYPRSLIRSEVKPINWYNPDINYRETPELFDIDELPFQKVTQQQTKASPKLISLMKDFIKSIGVDYKVVENITINGVKQDANAVALIMQKLIQVVEGKEDEALPEEAMHFAVEIIKQTNKPLYQQLLKEINGHTTLKQVVEEYGNNPFYQKDGKRDYLKLKEEAIAQVLANRLEDVIGRTWWEKISDYLKGLFFGKSGFDQAIIDVLTGKIESVDNIDATNNSPYFQLSKGEKIFNDLLSTSNRIKVVPNGVDENGKEKTTYELDDIKADKRVSDFAKLFYEKIFGKGIDESEFNKAVNDLKAEKGTAGHSDLEHAFELFVDPETGLLREEPLDDDNYVSKLNTRDSTLYLKLRENLQERLASFPEGTRFLSEVKIFDKKRKVAGTVDFVAITPEGKMNILDWKFMDLNTDKYEDVPWYKVRAWDIQMKKYKDIIATNYNVKNEEFGQTRMIPILAKYTKADFEKEILPRLLSIKIGDVNVQNIEEDYLLPVGITEEKTGNKKIDTLISKLNSVYKKLSEEKVGETEKTAKAEQLNALYKAIRHLQIKGNVVPLINQAKILNKQVSVLLKKYAVEFEGQTPETIDKNKVNAFAGIIRIHLEALEPYLDLKQLRFLLEDETEENIKLKEELRKTIEKVEDYISDLQDLDKEFGEKFNNTSSTPEKVVKGITKWFSSISTIQVGNIQTLYKLANKAFALAGQETLDEVKKLNTIKDNYDKWASSKNLSKGNYFSALIKKNKNELIDEFDPEFYKTLKDKIAKKDFDWILDNTDKLAYKEYIDNKKEKEIDRIFSRPRIGTEEEVKAIIGREIAKVYDKYDIDSTDSKGWLLYDDVKKFPIRKLWESKEYKELSKPENSPAKDFYNYIVERNKYYQEIGYLNGKPTRKFLPWIKQGFIEGLVFDGKTRGLGEEFLRNISMDEGEAGYGQTDPITGELINSVPRYFTKDLGEGYSTDLFKTMSLYNEYAIKFKNITDIEERALQLLRAERNKKSIMSSKFGQMIKEGDEPKYNETNLENSKLLDDMIKGIIYQQKFVESEVFDVALGKISGFGKNLNEKLGMKIFPEDLENRQISLNKSINTLNTHFQVVTLGLNTLSSISNLFGGTANGLINSGKYFTKTDFLKTQMWLLTNKMKGRMFGKESLEENPAKALAALDYFLPFVENYNRYAATKLSLNKLDEQNLQDYLMVLMRKGDEAVQTLNFFAFLKNAIVVDGKITNVREYLKKTPKYQNFYTGTQAEREQKVKDFEKDVEELLDTQSVLKLGELKDGEFSIPTVDKKSDSVIEFRRLVQSFTSDALGSMSEENRRLVNMNVYSSSAMVFKNWIPRLVDVRIGNIKYNAASDAYEWGRMRMLFGMITTDVFKSINSLKSALSGDSDVWLEQVKELYEKKKIDYYNNTGKELEMTEDEFISLVNQNIKNQALDLAVLLSLVSFLCILKAIPPDDEDPIVKNQYKFLLKATDKLTDELSYFYNPSSPFNLISQGIFPSLALLENYSKILKNFTKENYGIITGDEKMQDDAHTIKYIMKSFPLTNQVQQLLPLFYPELAKDLGIRMQSQYNRK